jgi:probable addiction module antidote protein
MNVAKMTGIPREHLYTVLSEKGNPTLESFHSIMAVLGFQLQVKKRA